jgi:hypothetical protein
MGRKLPFAHWRLRLARQPHRELAVVADLAVYSDDAAMLLRDDVVGDRQAEPGALASRLGGEERLEQFVLDIVGDTRADVVGPEDYTIIRVPRQRQWLPQEAA